MNHEQLLRHICLFYQQDQLVYFLVREYGMEDKTNKKKKQIELSWKSILSFTWSFLSFRNENFLHKDLIASSLFWLNFFSKRLAYNSIFDMINGPSSKLTVLIASQFHFQNGSLILFGYVFNNKDRMYWTKSSLYGNYKSIKGLSIPRICRYSIRKHLSNAPKEISSGFLVLFIITIIFDVNRFRFCCILKWIQKQKKKSVGCRSDIKARGVRIYKSAHSRISKMKKVFFISHHVYLYLKGKLEIF